MIIAAFILDALLGDPRRLPHPVRVFGFLIGKGEILLRRIFPHHLRFAGTVLVIFISGAAFAVPCILVFVLLYVEFWAGFALAVLFGYQSLAARGLRDEALSVYRAASLGDIEGSRAAVAMIVGRDSAALSIEGVVKATVETVAENLCDGVIAPLFYLGLGFALGGPALAAGLAFFYKAANTLDSMIAYKSPRYIDFGRCAAKLDDALSFIPARISALLLIAAAFLAAADSKGAARIFWRDRRKHASPNAGQSEAAMAGALGLALGGGAYYGGVFEEKPVIGDRTREAEASDIKKACKLMSIAALLFLPLDAGLEALFFWRSGLWL